MEESKIHRIGKGIRTLTGASIAVLFGVLATLSATGIHWILKTWSHLSMEELVFHLKAPLKGTSKEMVWDFFWSSGIFVIAVFILLVVIFIILRNRRRLFCITMFSTLLVSILVTILSGAFIWNKLEISKYKIGQFEYSDFIDRNYVDPNTVNLMMPEKKRNLIYIFLESVEATYADEKSGGLFKENVIPELTELGNEGENFSGSTKEIVNGGYPAVGTSWTIAAMFAQTTGLPLKVPINGNTVGEQGSFLPEVISLGDILDEEGYQQELLIGSDADFGGRDLYFSQHGNYKIFDYPFARMIGKFPRYYNEWWGFEDDKLFEYAKEELQILSASEQPFNLTLLTADTHFEDGYECKDCPSAFGKDQYSNVMACSSRKVSEFVKWVQCQDFYENTTIVIAGDHLTQDSDYCDDIENVYDRKTFAAYINAAAETESDSYRIYTTFDHFPTTLASLGVQIEGNRLGLGTNLFSNEQTLAERFGYERMDRELSRKSKLMNEFSAYMRIEE